MNSVRLKDMYAGAPLSPAQKKVLKSIATKTWSFFP